jgi:membrane protease YdiL (CAAX protease family)
MGHAPSGAGPQAATPQGQPPFPQAAAPQPPPFPQAAAPQPPPFPQAATPQQPPFPQFTGGAVPPPGFPVGPPPTAPPQPPTPPAAPRRTHRWGLGAFALAELAFLVCSVLVAWFLVDPDAPSVSQLGIAVAVPTLVAAGVAIAATRLRGNGPVKDLRLVWSWRDVGAGLAFGIGGLFLTTIAAMVWVSIVGPDVNSAVGAAFEGQRAGWPAALGIALLFVVVAPICEEILYRGLLWGALERIGANRWVCFAVTTFVFALFHFEPERAPLLLVISIPIGLARLYTGRLLAGIIAHQVNNFLPGVVVFLALTGNIAM